MKYKGKNYQMCDAWFLNVNNRIHAFNLKLPGSTDTLSVAHSYTDDLLHFHSLPDILYPLQDENLPEDFLDKWTGCGYTSPDGTHYIYYTMRNKYESQKIGVAITNDLETFKPYSKNPVLVPDSRIFAYSGQDGIKEDCRDIIVVFCEKTNTYYGYFATMAHVDGRYVGVIGVAESKDLLHWDNQSIAYTPRFDGVVEVPDVYFLDGKWYLTVLTHNVFGAKGNFSDPHIQSGTLYACADTPHGPFIEGDDNVFIGGTQQSGYTCRTFMYRGKRYVMYIDKSEYGWAVSLPKEVRVIEGKLRPCYSDIIKSLRKNTLIDNLNPEILRKESCSIAWHVGSGIVTKMDNGISIKTNPYSYQHYMIDTIRCDAAEIEYELTLQGEEGGIVIKGEQREYFITANTHNHTLTIYIDGIAYSILSQRSYMFEKGKTYSIRIIALEGQIEVYVDDVLVMQNGFETNNMQFGLITGCGECVFSSFKLFLL